MVEGGERRGGWRRAAALLAAVFFLSVAPPGVLIAIPFAFLVLLVPPRRAGAVALGVAAVFLTLAVGGESGPWYLERGWAVVLAGWFVGLTLRWPDSGFLARGLGAVAGALATALVLFLQDLGGWAAVDWLVWSRLQGAASSALTALRLLRGGGELPPALVGAVYRTVDVQRVLFPALLALASVAALGVAWWAYVRLARRGDRALAPLREFRFSDQLVWVLVLGVILLLAPLGEPWRRAGSNAVVFMSALYALRGAAVILFLSGGLSLLGTALLMIGMVFVAPLLVGAALVVGLGDTWLDLRRRLKVAG